MRKAERSQTRPLFVEQLEDRSLLSASPLMEYPARMWPTDAAWLTLAAPVPVNAAFMVTDWDVAGELNVDVAIDKLQLPDRILEAMDTAFPGWTLVRADLSTEAGAPEYVVSAKWHDLRFDIILASDGRICETERNVQPSDLPLPLISWVQAEFPGAFIWKADRVTALDGVAYSLRLITPVGDQVEATVRLDGQAQDNSLTAALDAGARPSSASTLPRSPLLGSTESITPADLLSLEVAHVFAAPAPSESERVTNSTRWSDKNSESHDEPDNAGPQPEAEAQAELSPPDDASAESVLARSGAIVMQNLVASPLAATGTHSWSSPEAVALCEYLSSDVADIVVLELGLQQLLDGLDNLGLNLPGQSRLNSLAWQMALAVVIVAGARLVIVQARRSRSEPLLGLLGESNSWSWVVGEASPLKPYTK